MVPFRRPAPGEFYKGSQLEKGNVLNGNGNIEWDGIKLGI